MNEFVVVDASVALKWILAPAEESHVPQARALLEDTLKSRGHFLVPPHFFAEVVNVLYHRIRTNRPELRLTPAEAAEALATLQKLPVEAITPPDLYERALALALQHVLPGAYDALYLAVAELAESVLWTDDRRLLDALSGALTYARWIHDYPSDPLPSLNL